MPKTRIGEKFKPKAPPLDPARGNVLDRMQSTGMSMKRLAEVTGFHYDTIRHTMTLPPIEWPPNQRDAILVALQLKARLVIEDASE